MDSIYIHEKCYIKASRITYIRPELNIEGRIRLHAILGASEFIFLFILWMLENLQKKTVFWTDQFHF